MEEFLRNVATLEWRAMKSHPYRSQVYSEQQFAGAADFVFDQGIDMVSKPLSRSQTRDLKKDLSNTRVGFEPKSCFHSSQLFVVQHGLNRYQYCEGYAMGKAGFPVPHAWIVMDDDHVIDLVWRPATQGVLHEGWRYKGVFVPANRLLDEILRTEHTQSFLQTPDLLSELMRGRTRQTEKPCTKWLDSLSLG